jgi:hypothetical protein
MGATEARVPLGRERDAAAGETIGADLALLERLRR